MFDSFDALLPDGLEIQSIFLHLPDLTSEIYFFITVQNKMFGGSSATQYAHFGGTVGEGTYPVEATTGSYPFSDSHYYFLLGNGGASTRQWWCLHR
jgi:hypothetical protein